MGFKVSRWDEKLLYFSQLFEKNMMNLEVNYSLEEALNIGWKILSDCFEKHEVGIKSYFVDKYWPKA